MRVVVNGQQRTVDAGSSVADLVRDLGLSTERVAVEINRSLLPRRDHAQRRLADGDVLEVVTLVGGG